MNTRWQPRTGVVLHTFDHTDLNWFAAVWGTPSEPGRIPTAVAATLEAGAELLLVFTDIIPTDGKNTGAIMRDFLFSHMEELPKFAPSLPVLGEFSLSEIREILGRVFLLSDVRIVPTSDEVAAVPPIFKEKELTVAIFVSNFDHISRIAQLVGSMWKKMGITGLTPVFRPAKSLYSGDTMKNVVVFEPPATRGLLPVHPGRLLGLKGNSDALAQVDAVLKKFGA